MCQCINNAYVCDSSSCQQQTTAENIVVELTTRPSPVQTTTTFEEEPVTTEEIVRNVSTAKSTTEEPWSTSESMSQRFSTVRWPESTTLRPLFVSTTPENMVSYSTVVDGTTTTEEIIFVPSTVSPPMVLCDMDKWVTFVFNSNTGFHRRFCDKMTIEFFA